MFVVCQICRIGKAPTIQLLPYLLCHRVFYGRPDEKKVRFEMMLMKCVTDA